MTKKILAALKNWYTYGPVHSRISQKHQENANIYEKYTSTYPNLRVCIIYVHQISIGIL